MRLLAITWAIAHAALIVVVWLRLARPSGLSRRIVVWFTLGAAMLVAPTRLLQGFVLDTSDLTTSVSVSGGTRALLAALVLLAPIEQAALVLVVWPIHRGALLHRVSAAIAAGVLVALGFSSIDGGWMLLTDPRWLTLVRALIRSAHTVGGCMVWAAAASYDQNRRKHWFAPAWFLAVAIQGFGNHVALGRGPGFGVVAFPLLVVVFGWAVWLIRTQARNGLGHAVHVELIDEALERPSRIPRLIESLPAIRQLSRVSLLPERPTIHQIRVAWQHQHRPALLHWIAAGAVICLGALFIGITLAVVTAHRIGMDLSRIDDADLSATGPILFLGIFMLSAFPIAGFLVALASAADSVFEPGMGALLAIVIIVALLSVAAPLAVIFALAVAPLAFGLACVGAWFGIKR